MRKWYTKKAFRLMNSIRIFILIITSVIWVPGYFLVLLGEWMETLLNYLDGILDKVLDKVIPQIK